MSNLLLLAAALQVEVPHGLASWEVPSFEIPDKTPQVFAVTRAQRFQCVQPGLVCLLPGGNDTVLGIEVADGAPAVTVLARGTQVAGSIPEVQPEAQKAWPWQVEMLAHFAAPSEHGPIIVALFDQADPESIAHKEAKVIWDVTMMPSDYLGMRFLLLPEDGFEVSHTYLLRVVQTSSKHERILAEGEVHLE